MFSLYMNEGIQHMADFLHQHCSAANMVNAYWDIQWGMQDNEVVFLLGPS